MEIRFFLFSRAIVPEWGQSRKQKDKYFTTDSIDKLLNYISKEYHVSLEKVEGSTNYRGSHYYSMDREELECELIEIHPTEVFDSCKSDDEDEGDSWW